MTRKRDELTRRELQARREREKKDLAVEANREPRPLEGFSEAPGAIWTDETVEREAERAHGSDEERSRRASVRQVTRLPRD